MGLKKTDNLPLLILLIINTIYFAGIITYNPGFQTDDMLVMSLVKDNPYPVVTYPGADFLLFSRPVSYFSFYLDSLFWQYKPALMKIFSLALHLIFITIVYQLIRQSAILLKVKFDKIMAAAVLLLLTFHPDTSIWISWISNRTELLCILFYAASLLCSVKYLSENKASSVTLTGYAGFYLLSVLSKSQSLHLPILVILLLLAFKHKFNPERTRMLMRTSIVLAAVMAVFVFINYMLYMQGTDFLNYFYKKPFTMAGIMVYSIFPYWAEDIYTFFLSNKLLAAVIFLLIQISAGAYLNKKEIKIPAVIIFTSFAVITFFPRLSAGAMNRINTVQIFWLVILLYIAGQTIFRQKKKLFYIITGFYAALNLCYSLKYQTINKEYNAVFQKQTESFNSQFASEKRKVVVLAAFNNVLLPYHSYYSRNNSFGKDSMIISPIYVYPMVYSWKILDYSGPVISGKMNGNIFTIINPDTNSDLYYRFGHPDSEKFRLINYEKYPDTQSAKTISAEIPEEYMNAEYLRVYYNGIEWIRL